MLAKHNEVTAYVDALATVPDFDLHLLQHARDAESTQASNLRLLEDSLTAWVHGLPIRATQCGSETNSRETTFTDIFPHF